MALNMKPSCPKCGSKDISKIKTGLPLGRSGGLTKTGKQWPEPYNDEPTEYHLPPMMDFNHTHHCNSCGHSFGGSWGGAL
jgi:ribosomal protein L37AE/L43A